MSGEKSERRTRKEKKKAARVPCKKFSTAAIIHQQHKKKGQGEKYVFHCVPTTDSGDCGVQKAALICQKLCPQQKQQCKSIESMHREV